MRNSRLINLLIAHGFFLWTTCILGQISIYGTLCENCENPLGIDIQKPKFSWVLSSDGRDKRQSAYRIQVSAKEEDFGEQLVRDSGKVASDQSVIYYVSIPVNTTAEVHLPKKSDGIMEGNTPLSRSKHVRILEKRANFTLLEIGSGNYTFTLKK